MPARLAAAVPAVVLAVSLTAGTAGATVATTPGPQHKCDSAEPLEKKCDDTK